MKSIPENWAVKSPSQIIDFYWQIRVPIPMVFKSRPLHFISFAL